MKAKIGIVVLVAAVAVVAFVVGSKFRSAPEAVDEITVSEPAPPAELPAAEEPPAPLPPAPAPRRPRPASAQPVARPAVSPPEPAAPTPPSEPASTGVRPSPPRELRVREGTKIFFTLNNTLSTKTNQVGDPFAGVVSRSVRVGDKVAIPEGSAVRGSISHVERAGRVKGRAELGLRFEALVLPSGEVLQMAASLSDLGESEKETVAEEGEVKGEGTKTRDAVTVGGGAGVGTAIGAIAGGGKGAAIGAGTGAAAGAAVVLLTRGKDVELKRGSELAIQLDRPLTVREK